MEYLKEQEAGILHSLMGLADDWEACKWDRKVGQMKGVLILIRMILALPTDARERVKQAVERKEIG